MRPMPSAPNAATKMPFHSLPPPPSPSSLKVSWLTEVGMELETQQFQSWMKIGLILLQLLFLSFFRPLWSMHSPECRVVVCFWGVFLNPWEESVESILWSPGWSHPSHWAVLCGRERERKANQTLAFHTESYCTIRSSLFFPLWCFTVYCWSKSIKTHLNMSVGHLTKVCSSIHCLVFAFHYRHYNDDIIIES